MADENKTDDENEAVAVTGRPNDIPIRDPEPAPLGGNTTFSDRAKAAKKATASTKQVDEGENKAVTSASTKSRRARKARKS